MENEKVNNEKVNNGKANNGKVNMEHVIYEANKSKRDKKYNQYVQENTPKKNCLWNLCKAFVVGGLICVLGQALNTWFMSLGFDKDTSARYNVLSLIMMSAILTGLNIYPKLAEFCGAGTLGPITGFANSITSAAIEFKKEGQVYGIGSQIFTIAGPVILYGIFSSWLLGLIYWLCKITGLV
jgi:stage V sporulation protein AC